ncbi:glycosyltransferase [Streptomyces sp. M19]
MSAFLDSTLYNFRYYLVYLPLGVLGLVRWGCWLLRRSPAALYRPVRNDFRLPLSIVVPVYQEDPEIFAHAIESWLANDVEEIVLVIDVTDRACQEVAARYPVTVVVTDVPGKRDALRRGWEACHTELVALVDSDTIWAEDVAAEVCKPFADPRVGGWHPAERLQPRGFLQRVNDMYLDYRYFDENAAQTVMGQAVSCLSGRTAVYRRELLLEISGPFMNETFLGVPCMSGDDKRLTTLVLERGHRTYMQRSARVWSTFPGTWRIFVKQRLRWARNTWRSDLRALTRPWIRHHPSSPSPWPTRGEQLHAAVLAVLHDLRDHPRGLVLRRLPGRLVVDQPRHEDAAAPGAQAVLGLPRPRLRTGLVPHGRGEDLRPADDPQAALADPAGVGRGRRPGPYRRTPRRAAAQATEAARGPARPARRPRAPATPGTGGSSGKEVTA